jgi:RNA polymerase sigma-70 factor (ECF subfamily)
VEHYAHLLNIARSLSRVPDEAEDLLHDALLEAIRSGRSDFSQAATLRWLSGTMRNLAAMAGRSAQRRRLRDSSWAQERGTAAPPRVAPTPWRDDPRVAAAIASLPPSLRRVAELALSGLDRGEIAWILGVSDVTLRQRISVLRKRLGELEAAPSADGALDLPVGLMRRALLPVVRATAAPGTHDPDGHLLVLSTRARSES